LGEQCQEYLFSFLESYQYFLFRFGLHEDKISKFDEKIEEDKPIEISEKLSVSDEEKSTNAAAVTTTILNSVELLFLVFLRFVVVVNSCLTVILLGDSKLSSCLIAFLFLADDLGYILKDS
jgi:hypothetical protein